MAEFPHLKAMLPGEFLQHWVAQHPGEPFATTHETFPDDTVPLWSAIKNVHERIHAGTSGFDVPTPKHQHEAAPGRLEALLAEIL